MSAENLTVARRKLNDVLDQKSTKYFAQMKLWFRMKLTKEEFDAEARKLLNSDQIHFHNEFLLALLNKVSGLAETSITIAEEKAFTQRKDAKKHKRNSTRTSEKCNFDPVDLGDYLSPKSPQGAGTDGVKYAAQEVFLPDHALVVGRFMLAAWDVGLEGVEDDAADIMVVATQTFLKNVLTAVIARRKGYKKKQTFMYDLGADMPNMWLRNSAKVNDPLRGGRVEIGEGVGMTPQCPPTIDEVEHSAALEMACSGTIEELNENRLTLDEVYHTLFTNRNIIASHSVYAINMERIACMLNHPST